MNTEQIFNDLVTVVSDKVKYIEKLLWKSMEADNGNSNLSS